MDTLISAMVSEFAGIGNAGKISLGVASADSVQHLSCHHVKVPRLGVQRCRRPHRNPKDFFDQCLGHRLGQIAPNAPPAKYDSVVFHKTAPAILSCPSVQEWRRKPDKDACDVLHNRLRISRALNQSQRLNQSQSFNRSQSSRTTRRHPPQPDFPAYTRAFREMSSMEIRVS